MHVYMIIHLGHIDIKKKLSCANYIICCKKTLVTVVCNYIDTIIARDFSLHLERVLLLSNWKKSS